MSIKKLPNFKDVYGREMNFAEALQFLGYALEDEFHDSGLAAFLDRVLLRLNDMITRRRGDEGHE